MQDVPKTTLEKIKTAGARCLSGVLARGQLVSAPEEPNLLSPQELDDLKNKLQEQLGDSNSMRTKLLELVIGAMTHLSFSLRLMTDVCAAKRLQLLKQSSVVGFKPAASECVGQCCTG